MSGDFAVVREYVVAASSVPASASNLSLHEGQPSTVAQTAGDSPPVLASLSADYPHAPNLPHPLDGRRRSSSAVSSASDRRSIITNWRESMRASVRQPSRHPRTSRRRLSLDPELSQSRERPTRPPISTTRPHTATHPPRLEIITTDLISPTHEDGKTGPVVQPPTSSSYTHELQSAPPLNEIRTGQPDLLTSIVVDVQHPSTDSLPISSWASPPQIADEPFAVESSTVHSSPDLPAVDLPDEPGSPTSSNAATLDYFIPDGRFVQLINSDHIPRYTKNATMQVVGYSILSLHTYISLQIPRGDGIRCETFNNRFPLVGCNFHDILQFNRALSSFPEPDDSEKDSLQQDCTPWIPATHPNGALYFYDSIRVRVSVIMENLR